MIRKELEKEMGAITNDEWWAICKAVDFMIRGRYNSFYGVLNLLSTELTMLWSRKGAA